MNKKKQTAKYVFFDVLAAMIAWASLFIFRKLGIERDTFDDVNAVFADKNFWLGIVLVPAGWVCLYVIQGIYRNVYRKSRLKELQQTAFASLFGVLIIFFFLLIDDDVHSYGNYYFSFVFLLVVHFVLTYTFRVIITTHTANLVHSRRIGFPTLMIGCKERAYKTYLDLDNQEIYSGNLFVGYIPVNGCVSDQLARVMPCAGKLVDLERIVQEQHVEEVIIATENSEADMLKDIIRTLNHCSDVIVKVPPDTRDIIFGSVKLNSIFHSPLITINPRLMEEWQYSVKRIMDVVISLLAMIILSPVYLVTAILVKMSSPGPIFYAQERVGKNGKPFKMHKFRSMYENAEKEGPRLSSDNDPRITPFGTFMRKVRLDEIPQFYNVLRGTMSLVGPRPERQYFIDRIVERAPEYLLLQRIKPGITSWGQVKYGYAENVDEMIERMRYDLLYLENMSIATDIKILIYTVIIVLEGRGK
jgi:exopolysaccharide biosynthesis polyprenyl glycosylphosphotransferase